MTGAVISERSSDRRARERLRAAAREWFPTLDGDAIDQLVAGAWIEALEDGAVTDDTIAARAAACVRRCGHEALQRRVVDTAADARARVAAIALVEPLDEDRPVKDSGPMPAARRARHRRRRHSHHRAARRVLAGSGLAVVVTWLAVLVLGGDAPSGQRSAGIEPVPATAQAATDSLGESHAMVMRLRLAAQVRSAHRHAERRLRAEQRRHKLRALRRARARRRARAERRAAARRHVTRPTRVIVTPPQRPAPARQAPPRVVTPQPHRNPAPTPQSQAGTWGSELGP